MCLTLCSSPLLNIVGTRWSFLGVCLQHAAVQITFAHRLSQRAWNPRPCRPRAAPAPAPPAACAEAPAPARLRAAPAALPSRCAPAAAAALAAVRRGACGAGGPSAAGPPPPATAAASWRWKSSRQRAPVRAPRATRPSACASGLPARAGTCADGCVRLCTVHDYANDDLVGTAGSNTQRGIAHTVKRAGDIRMQTA